MKAISSSSTGPRTAAGKAISSRNAYQHGVYSKQLLLREEEKADFAHFQQDLRSQLHPDSPLEAEIFTRLLRTLWMLRRLDRREDQVFLETGLPLAAVHPKEFENTLRYRRFLAKEHRDLLAELRRVQSELAVRHLGSDYAALCDFSPLVDARSLVDLENARCAARNQGQPRIRFGRPLERVGEPGQSPESRV